MKFTALPEPAVRQNPSHEPIFGTKKRESSLVVSMVQPLDLWSMFSSLGVTYYAKGRSGI
jgi:hypothetical protein